ncbi:uncharacterized protein LOC131650191 [Vicia villosa]|uniref:uncharacterized protein LOC131650191 n=1 Tax=Vicia villosa TaxID=3911 RepID=UPI00273A94AF|nr:uncharacterized protein LOC131650191 [Vicia villosa]
MARPFENLKDINESKELWKIAVRVHHKWSVVSRNKEHFEMILVDKEDLQDVIIVCKVYMMMLTYMLSVFYVLLYLIGMVSDIGYTQIHAVSKKQQINLVLKDLGNNTINCTLWEGYALQFYEYQQQKNARSTPTLIALQYAKVKEEGKYPLCVSNTFNVTKLHINDDLPQIKEFLNKFRDTCITTTSLVGTSSQNMTKLSHASEGSASSQLIPYDKFMYKTVVLLPLTEIVKLKNTNPCVTVSKIEKVIPAHGGWYEILIDVVSEGCQATFVIWDRECTQLLKLIAAQMRNIMIEVSL